MRVEKFSAKTVRDALTKVKAELGPEAVILRMDNHKGRGLTGLFSPGHVEITAATGVSMTEDDQRPLRPKPDACFQQGDMKGIHAELVSLRQIISSLVAEQARSGMLAQLTAIAQQAYNTLIEQGLGEELAFRLAKAVGSSGADELAVLDDYSRAISSRLITMVPISGPIESRKGRRKIVAMIGPTGVGKTTTIAKLAAGFALANGLKVGLVTTDTYRIAAVEQLKTYADIMGIPVDVVYDANGMQKALKNQEDRDIVLIDTSGCSPRNRERLSALADLLGAARPYESHLVISATTRTQDLKTVLEGFDIVGYDRLIITKLDESQAQGVLVSAPLVSGKPVAYLTSGQNVPDDIEPARIDRVRGIMESWWAGLRQNPQELAMPAGRR